MSIRSILVASDLSATENIAVMRAEHLARTHNASLKLLYVPQHGKPAVADAHAKLTAMARRAETDLMLDVEALPVAAADFDGIVDSLRGIDLVVLPHRRERSLVSWFRGQPVIRLMRTCEVPVLVVRRMAEQPYARVLAAIDLSKHAVTVGAFACGLQPAAELRLVHAISTGDESKLVHAGVSGLVIKTYRERSVSRARNGLQGIASRLGAPGKRPLLQIRHGDPARQAVVQQESSGADVIVVGKERGSACSDFMWGSVAQNVLAWGRSDVLIVPRPKRPAGMPAGASREGARSRRRALRPPEGRSAA